MKVWTIEEAEEMGLRETGFINSNKDSIIENCIEERKKYPKARIKLVDDGVFFVLYADDKYFLYEEAELRARSISKLEREKEKLRKRYDAEVEYCNTEIHKNRVDMAKIFQQLNDPVGDPDRWICDKTTCYNVEENIKNGCTANCKHHKGYKGKSK
jgi:hypothetical protein